MKHMCLLWSTAFEMLHLFIFHSSDKPDTCASTTSSVLFQQFNGKRVALLPGAPCSGNRGYCDRFKLCRILDADGPIARLKNYFLKLDEFEDLADWMKVSTPCTFKNDKTIKSSFLNARQLNISFVSFTGLLVGNTSGYSHNFVDNGGDDLRSWTTPGGGLKPVNFETCKKTCILGQFMNVKKSSWEGTFAPVQT